MIYWSANRMATEIRSGKVTSRELVEACYKRIEQVNPLINAVVQRCTERAILEAERFDRMTVNRNFQGPLHGVPMTIKDSFDTDGIITTGGTLGRKDHIPKMDAPVVNRLRQAGAILLGKTNTPELTLSGETNNLIYGRTSNPYDLDRSPGGSSGGSAAIVASGGSPFDLGSDTGGSIREPAHLTGITGIKPTSGRTPRTGHIVSYDGGVLDGLTQIGPMARYIDDLNLILPIICGPDGCDPSTVPVPLHKACDVSVSDLRIAWYADNNIVAANENIQRVIEETANSLKQDGLSVTHKVLPHMQQLVDLVTQLRQSTNVGFILRLLQRCGTENPGPDLATYLNERGMESSNNIDPALIEKIDRCKSQALSFFKNYDVILCPASKELARHHNASLTDTYKDWSYMIIHNLLGWPGVTVRAGTSKDGMLPVGVQVVAAPWREDHALALAKRIEVLMGGFIAPQL